MKLGCCNKLMDMVRAAYDMATHAIKGVQLGSDPEIKYPDGAGIIKLNVPDAQTLDEIQSYIEVSKATDERLSLDIDRLDTSKQDALIAGANITISADNVISATGGGGGGSGSDFTAQNNDGSIMFYKDGVKQAELTEGANITISADGVISATGGGTGGTPTADEVLLSDGRSVQDGIDSIEDELGDLGTSGTVQSRLEALETSDASQNADITNLENKAVEYDGRLGSLSQAIGACVDDFTIDKGTAGKIGITMDKIDGMTSQSADIITAGDGVTIENGVISASGGSDASVLIAVPATFFIQYATVLSGDAPDIYLRTYNTYYNAIAETSFSGGKLYFNRNTTPNNVKTLASSTGYKIKSFRYDIPQALQSCINITGDFTGKLTVHFCYQRAMRDFVSQGEIGTEKNNDSIIELTYTHSIMTAHSWVQTAGNVWSRENSDSGQTAIECLIFNVEIGTS